MKAIDIKGLSKTYKQGMRFKVDALQNLNLEIKKGEIFGFLGPNGAGKSTTIKLLLNILRPSSGQIQILERSVDDPMSRSQVGYLPENPAFLDYLTPLELLHFVGKSFNVPTKVIQQRAEKLVDEIGLQGFQKVSIRNFSKGMVQKVGIIQTLIHDPDILILDEPSSGLDPVGRKQLTDLLISLKEKGKTIFFSSHILHDVETVCDRVGIVLKGKLMREERISSLITQSFDQFEIIAPKLEQSEKVERLKKKFPPHEEGKVFKFLARREELWSILELIRDSGSSILSIEPKRKTMETVFMEIIERQEGKSSSY